MKKLIAIALVALLLAPACGGGGGGTPGGDGMDPPPDLTAAQRTQEMLEDCQIEEAIAAAKDVVGFLNDLAAGTATAAGFTSAGGFTIDDTMVSIPWSLDIDNSTTTDATGTLEFLDTSNMPTNPVPPADPNWVPFFMSQDLDTIATILAGGSPPDGTVLFSDFNGSNIVLATGQVGAFYASGAATTTQGNIGVSPGTCNVAIAWAAQLIANFLTAFPSVTVTGTIVEGGDTITGNIITNGTNIATTTMTINGGESNDFTINLTTGAITHVP